MSKNLNLSDLNYLQDKFLTLPKEKVTSNLVETAERIRVFPPGSPFPGPQKYAKTPYMIEPAMELSPQSDTEEVVIAKAGQMGATAGTSEPLILFKIDQDPGPVLAITATDELAKTWSDDRLEPMFEQAGVTFKSTTKKNSQHGGNGSTALKKTWYGGRLDIKTYGKISQIRQISYQVVILEEEEEQANAKKTGVKQGNFRDVAYARTRAFRGRRKILRISTPLLTQSSVIYPAFLAGDQRYFYIPCPECGHLQHLEWKNLKFKHDENNKIIPGTVYYECQGANCEHKIKNSDKTEFLKTKEFGGTAKWIPHNEKKAKPLTKSYQFSALYAPVGMDTWEDLAQQWCDIGNDDEKRQTFWNLNLGLPYDDYSEAPPAETLHILKGTYKQGQLPDREQGSPLFTMLGADVQAGNKRDGKWVKGKESRIEASLWGYGLNDREWLIDHYIIYGEVKDWRSGAFAKLKKMIVKDVFPMTPVMTFIDSRHQTNQVKSFCNLGLNIFPVMGTGKTKKGVFNKVDLSGYQSGTGGPLPLYELNNNSLKRDLYNALGLRQDPTTNEYPAGYMMFPHDLEAKFFEQLTSERPISVIKNGKHHHYEWEAHGANETFDCALYSKQAKNVFMFERSILNGEETTNEREFWKWAYGYFGLPKVTMLELIEKHKRLWEILLA